MAEAEGASPPRSGCCCATAEFPYTAAVAYRNRRYDLGRAAIHHVAVPVISVGNLTLGGTGKTPMVKWVARRLLAQGSRVAIVSRGYGAAAGQQNDEARELSQALPEVPHVQNRDRVAGAERAIAEFSAQCILLDDGFQHRRLARDLDIVLLDALEPFGFEHVFPRGTLREPLAGLKRAQAVCLSRADAISAADTSSDSPSRCKACSKRRVVRTLPHRQLAREFKRTDAAARSARQPSSRRVLRHRQPGRLSSHACSGQLHAGCVA